jgi:hypothetical protein
MHLFEYISPSTHLIGHRVPVPHREVSAGIKSSCLQRFFDQLALLSGIPFTRQMDSLKLREVMQHAIGDAHLTIGDPPPMLA